MGLDISVYTNIKQSTDKESSRYMLNDTSFADRFEHEEGYYGYEYSDDVFSSSYGRYNRLRNELAQLIGKTDKEVWENPNIEIPFVEIINFTDCDGTLGTTVCKKLLNDFNKYAEAAVVHSDEEFTSFYQSLHRGIEIAANNSGVIRYE